MFCCIKNRAGAWYVRSQAGQVGGTRPAPHKTATARVCARRIDLRHAAGGSRRVTRLQWLTRTGTQAGVN